MTHLFVVAYIFAAVIIGFSSGADAQTKIKLGYTAAAEMVSAYAAKEEGYFDKRNIDVEFVLMTVNSTTPQGLFSNALQVGALTPSVHLQAVDGGLDLVVIAGASVTHTSTLKNFGVVARSGVSITKPRDFVGKKVGVPGFGAFLHVLFRAWLMENGIDTKSVDFVEVGFPTMNEVLKAGSVDAVVTLEPVMSRIVASGTGTLVPSYELRTGQMIAIYSSTREWAAKTAAAVKGFREAIVEAAAFVAANPEKSRGYVAKYTKLPLDIVQTLRLPVTSPVVSVDQLNWWVDVMRKQDMLQTKFDVSKQILR